MSPEKHDNSIFMTMSATIRPRFIQTVLYGNVEVFPWYVGLIVSLVQRLLIARRKSAMRRRDGSRIKLMLEQS